MPRRDILCVVSEFLEANGVCGCLWGNGLVAQHRGEQEYLVYKIQSIDSQRFPIFGKSCGPNSLRLIYAMTIELSDDVVEVRAHTNAVHAKDGCVGFERHRIQLSDPDMFEKALTAVRSWL